MVLDMCYQKNKKTEKNIKKVVWIMYTYKK